ncbi:MAG: rod-binding protein [Thermodesulfobacteriota bacterium]|nr:rod-binding protein [Thermodesulfobacteriota bacterium]
MITTGFEQLSSVNLNYNTILNKINEKKSIISSERDKESIKKVCTQFESLLISFVIKAMRDTIPKTNLFGSGKGERLYSSLLDQELAKEIAQRQNFDIGSMLFKKLSLSD